MSPEVSAPGVNIASVGGGGGGPGETDFGGNAEIGFNPSSPHFFHLMQIDLEEFAGACPKEVARKLVVECEALYAKKERLRSALRMCLDRLKHHHTTKPGITELVKTVEEVAGDALYL